MSDASGLVRASQVKKAKKEQEAGQVLADQLRDQRAPRPPSGRPIIELSAGQLRAAGSSSSSLGLWRDKCDLRREYERHNALPAGRTKD